MGRPGTLIVRGWRACNDPDADGQSAMGRRANRRYRHSETMEANTVRDAELERMVARHAVGLDIRTGRPLAARDLASIAVNRRLSEQAARPRATRRRFPTRRLGELPAKLRELADLWNDGLTVSMIRDLVGLSWQAVNNRLHAVRRRIGTAASNGQPRTPVAPRLMAGLPRRRREFAEAWNAGATVAELRERFGYASDAAVSQAACKLRRGWRPRGGDTEVDDG